MEHIKGIDQFIYEGLDDDRTISWSELEKDAQERAPMKDPSFRLSGPWKKFLRKQDGYNVYIVDGEWVRTNLSIIFGHGSHGYVHEWCPNDEIWVAYRHTGKGCCKTRPHQRCSNNFIESTILHEITENKEMRSGKLYWPSHNISLNAERRANFLEDPYDDSQEDDQSISLDFKKD